MEITISVNYVVDLPDCKINTITSAYKKLQRMIFSDMVNQVLIQFATKYMSQKKKPFPCKCGNNSEFTWKTKNAKLMFFLTIRRPPRSTRNV